MEGGVGGESARGGVSNKDHPQLKSRSSGSGSGEVSGGGRGGVSGGGGASVPVRCSGNDSQTLLTSFMLDALYWKPADFGVPQTLVVFVSGVYINRRCFKQAHSGTYQSASLPARAGKPGEPRCFTQHFLILLLCR